MIKENRKVLLKELLQSLGITERVKLTLINQALTHPSYQFEESAVGMEHYQRLEFLGDAVIGLIIGQHLYLKYPQKSEGELTKMRAAVVCEKSLAQGARVLRLGSYLLLGKGEEHMGGAERNSNLADCFEALIGALYLSLGLEQVRQLVLATLKDEINNAAKGFFNDYKTQLQESVQRVPKNKLSYKILTEEGPDHKKNFLAAVYLNGEEAARGSGSTKKEAEQQAARLALQKMGGM